MIILVGTSHIYQMTKSSTPEGKEIKSYLCELCSGHHIVAIGEEMSIETLEGYESKESVPMSLTLDLGLQHCFCDPSPAEKIRLNIQQENDVRTHAQGFLHNCSEDEINTRIQDEYKKREKYWLEQLQSFDKWPLLFICGANHVESFSKLLIATGIEVLVASKDWEPRGNSDIS